MVLAVHEYCDWERRDVGVSAAQLSFPTATLNKQTWA